MDGNQSVMCGIEGFVGGRKHKADFMVLRAIFHGPGKINGSRYVAVEGNQTIKW